MASSITATPPHPQPGATPASLEKHDSGHAGPEDFEVASPMKLTHSGDPLNDRPSVGDKKPILERHISAIPSKLGEDELPVHGGEVRVEKGDGKEKKGFLSKLEAHFPGHKSPHPDADHDGSSLAFRRDSRSTHHESDPRSANDMEVVGTITKRRESDGSPVRHRPGLETHISTIPED